MIGILSRKMKGVPELSSLRQSCDSLATVLRLEPRFLCDLSDREFHSDALAKAVLFVLFSPFKKEMMMTLTKLQNRLAEITDQVIRIGTADRERIGADVQTLIDHNSFQLDTEADVLAEIGAAAIGKHLDRKERLKLEQFGMGVGEPFVMIDGLPQQRDLPVTPDMFLDDAEIQFTDSLLLGTIGLARLQSLAVAYENFGRLGRNVAPSKAGLNSISSFGSKEPLEFHADNGGYFKGLEKIGSPSPHFLCFASLRNQDKEGKPVPTDILRVADIVSQLGSKLLTTIQQPIFKIMPGESNKGRVPVSNVSLLHRDAVTGEWLLRFKANGSQSVGLNRRARHATKELIELIGTMKSYVIPIMITPGRVLMFDNYRVLHRRSSFEPGEDFSKAKWLRRIFACQDLRNGQQIDPIHRPFVWK